MKTITFFICSLHSGGAEHQLTILANFLVERNYIVKILTFSNIQDHYHIDKSIQRIKIYHKNKILNFLHIFFYILTLKTDCFVSFGQRENFLSLIPYLFKRSKYIAGERNYTVGNPSMIERILVNLLYRRADYIVPNSKSQGDYLSNLKPYIKKKIRIIHNFTDLCLFRPIEHPINKPIRIGIFCRFEPQKNILRFAKAIKLVKDNTDIPFQIIWYGNHNFENLIALEYFNKFKDQIKKDNLEDVILINDPIKNVSDHLPLFDAVALPSLFEGFSNSISEAICCGIPLLVSRVSDNPSMVHDGVNGFLFDPTSVNDIAESFCKFLNLSDIEKQRFGKESRKIAEGLFDKEKFISDYTDLF